MAEGWLSQLGGESIEVISAGIESRGKNPRAIEVMRQAGVDISRQESAQLTNEMLNSADFVITVCGHADENCPTLPVGTRKEHWPLADPAKAIGSADDMMAVFKASRDEIQHRVEDLIRRLGSERADYR